MTPRESLQRRKREVSRELRMLRHDLDARMGELLQEMQAIEQAEAELDAQVPQ